MNQATATKLERKTLSIGGGDHVSVLVSHEAGQPRTVSMSYEAFLEIVGTLYTAIDALAAGGLEEIDEPVTARPRLRVV